ncbi:hypothetical protein [Christensenella minuta]|uniref:hypothetical protein n=1 Tax=Christensenella minuta TaxID=626937 RepID=UPI002157571A|nr:hypothetical protein [Christensenella minuta]
MAKNGEAFYNNIIVALPNNVRFLDASGDSVPIDKVGNYETCKLELSEKWNSICVIDGQHRIFAHYEGFESDPLEKNSAAEEKTSSFSDGPYISAQYASNR